MNANQLAIARFLYVELKSQAKFQARAKVGQRVFGSMQEQPTVADNEGHAAFLTAGHVIASNEHGQQHQASEPPYSLHDSFTPQGIRGGYVR
jgi:hypothetical protein